MAAVAALPPFPLIGASPVLSPRVTPATVWTAPPPAGPASPARPAAASADGAESAVSAGSPGGPLTRRRSSAGAVPARPPGSPPAAASPAPITAPADAELSVEAEGVVVRRGPPAARSLRPRQPAAVSKPAPRPLRLARPAPAASRASTRLAFRPAADKDLDELADIVEIEDAEGVDVLLDSGRAIGHKRRQQRSLAKRAAAAIQAGRLARARDGSRPARPAVRAPVPARRSGPRPVSSFAAAAMDIYKPPQRTSFHVRHQRVNAAMPPVMDIAEMSRLISPLPSPSPSPPPDGLVDGVPRLVSNDPRRHCTHLRKCFNEATLIDFDKWGFVSSPPEARDLFRDEGLRCVRYALPAARCHTLHAEILSLLPLSTVTSWRGMGAGGASQKFLWLTEEQILRFGLEYRFDRHRPMPESRHQRLMDRIQKSFGKDFDGPVIALQPNFQQADFPLHTDQPSLEGFGNKIITVGVYGEGWVVIRDKDAKRSFKFKVGTGDAWAMVGKARWEWAHGVVCETYPSDMDDPEQQPNPDEPQKFRARRVSLNIRIE
ncbi:hypothetical protein DFJ74DRAFT_704772 [Hyaloraphidium curvatum]|nr:hypothetical protein DFJ74DRAFT_704772 [Hyaloraphidium curvatum]